MLLTQNILAMQQHPAAKSNVLIQENIRVYILDFCMLREKEPEFGGHLALVSPEVSAMLFAHVARLGSTRPSLKGLWLWHGSLQQSD